MPSRRLHAEVAIDETTTDRPASAALRRALASVASPRPANSQQGRANQDYRHRGPIRLGCFDEGE
ncbi:hypothetical protein MPLSOD_40534 [Mesorhizobium sp. SOD10]|nr:hypothetical protein MPLSOD_40534 [Mesorhizobium sp. SOD10]